MVQPIKAIKVLESGVEPTLKYLNKTLREKLGHVDHIVIDRDLAPTEHEIEKENDKPVILRLGSDLGREVLSRLPKLKDLKDKENDAYVIEGTGKFLGLTEYEESVRQTLKTFDDILGRAYNRRTNVSSWILYLTLRYMGFHEDDYKPIREILTGASSDDRSKKHDPEFITKYAQYLKLKEENEAKANEFLATAFEKDKKKDQKLGLIKLANLFTKGTNKLSTGFIDTFPLVFYVQNLAMPILARLYDKHPIGKLFKFMLVINPWVGDFFSEILANFKDEMKKFKGDFAEAKDPFKDNEEKPAVPKLRKKENGLIEEAEFVSLNKEQHGLKKAIGAVSDTFQRLFGRQNNITSFILNSLLWLTKGLKGYEDYAKKFVNDDKFVKNLSGHLKEVKDSVHNKTKEPELPKDKFSKEQGFVARIVLAAVSVANALKEKHIKTISNVFGGIFSVQNLFMPILAMFIKEGKLGMFIRFVRDVNPWANDLIDYVANFRKEILDVQSVNQNIPELLPKLTGKKVSEYCMKNLKGLWSAITQFSRRVFIPKTNAA